VGGTHRVYEKYKIFTKLIIIVVIVVVVVIECSHILLCRLLGTTFGLTPGFHGGITLCPLSK
jgi:hypothetical protein